MQADIDNGVVVDLGPRRLRAASNDPNLVHWLRDVLEAGDLPILPREATGEDPGGTETVVANIGRTAANRRGRHRLLDHVGTLWWSTIDRDEAAAALARAVTEQIAMANGGIWLTLPVLAPAGAASIGDEPAPAVLLHPYLNRSIDRLLPLLRRAGIAVHPSPQVQIDPTTGLVAVPPAPAPTGTPAPPAHLRPVALAGGWPELRRAEVVTWFAHAATRRDQAHLDVVERLSRAPGYTPVDMTGGLRATATRLAELVLAAGR